MRLDGLARRLPGRGARADGSPEPGVEPDGDGAQASGAPTTTAAPQKKKPLYPRLLRLRHVTPNAWQRAALGEGALAVAVLLVLADLASAWTLVVLPLAVAVVVKAHDGLAGLLAAPRPRTDAASAAAPPD